MAWKEDLIKYRREKAAETIEDARIMFERKRWFSTVNRIYYALFYEVIALLQTKDFSAPKHTGETGSGKLFPQKINNLPDPIHS
jgi:uncharacterized protein (UPF0332 family)